MGTLAPARDRGPSPGDYPPAKSIVRVVLIVVVAAAALGLIYLLRTPLTWLLLATILTVALSGPVNLLSRRMPRGAAIAIVFVFLLLVPVALAALVIPPVVREVDELARNLPGYVADVQDFVEGNETLGDLEKDYQITEKLEQQAEELPGRLGGAASALGGIGIGMVNSLFALVNILVLTAFMLAGGRGWVNRALALQPRDRAIRLRRVLERMASAVGGYAVGAIAVAFIAGTLAYLVLLVLGVPFRGPLAVVVGLFSLIPLVGATIAAVIVGLVTLFANFPTATIAWTVWAIAYQQVENNLIQPQVHRRTVNVPPFVVLVAVLFGATLLGVLGAVIAIPVAATIQIGLEEWWSYRAGRREAPTGEPGSPAPAQEEGAEANAPEANAPGPPRDEGGPPPTVRG